MSTKSHINSLDLETLSTITGGRMLLAGALRGTFEPGFCPRARFAWRGEWSARRQAALGGAGGGGAGGCAGGSCGG